ncbi:LysE family transporter [Zunongwangia sp. SCSIO 43204]|uniref:Threonine/homoserine/homoserine lactone efflux protein n=1 Tax=Zunongwangia mangrovi TaxID=1334022 RepID=A0A1I1DNI4_9FLAO|nr:MULTISPECIES: LysE family transporter [Zunongwangia]UAB85267.1 LysE family transporter [Zunongwangia sp. SCSIO 43204]SFB76407.1 Threonine/homoserine/homoserine lactone efflux protein [Zunongwangia mangrovi]
MLHDILAAMPLGLFLAFMLGPVFFVLLETAAIKGFRAAISFDLGVIIADTVFLFIAYLSTTKLLERIKDDPALFIFGGVILTTYGVMTFIQTKKALPQEEESPDIRKLGKSDYLGLALKGFLLNFINVGVLGFWLGLIIVFGPRLEMQSDRILVFFSTVLVTYLIVDVFKILLAKKLNRKLTPKRIYVMKKGISVMLVVFGIVLISQGAFPGEVNEIREQIDNITPGDGIGLFENKS